MTTRLEDAYAASYPRRKLTDRDRAGFEDTAARIAKGEHMEALGLDERCHWIVDQLRDFVMRDALGSCITDRLRSAGG